MVPPAVASFCQQLICKEFIILVKSAARNPLIYPLSCVRLSKGIDWNVVLKMAMLVSDQCCIIIDITCLVYSISILVVHKPCFQIESLSEVHVHTSWIPSARTFGISPLGDLSSSQPRCSVSASSYSFVSSTSYPFPKTGFCGIWEIMERMKVSSW